MSLVGLVVRKGKKIFPGVPLAYGLSQLYRETQQSSVDLERGLLSMFVPGNSAVPSEGLRIPARLLSVGAVARGSRWSLRKTDHCATRKSRMSAWDLLYLLDRLPVCGSKFLSCSDTIKMHYAILQKFNPFVFVFVWIWSRKLLLNGNFSVTSLYLHLP